MSGFFEQVSVDSFDPIARCEGMTRGRSKITKWGNSTPSFSSTTNAVFIRMELFLDQSIRNKSLTNDDPTLVLRNFLTLTILCVKTVDDVVKQG
jgi:hypothetical protein